MKVIGTLIFLLAMSYGFGQNKVENRPGTLSGILVEKSFISKSGDSTEITELYLRCSKQDYFIKFCESTVSSEDLKQYLNQSITFKCEMIEGEYDKCDENPVQSRVGTYLAVKAVMMSVRK